MASKEVVELQNILKKIKNLRSKIDSLNDSDTFKDILNNWIEEIPIVVSNYRNLNNKQRKTINDMLIIFGKSALDNFIHRRN